MRMVYGELQILANNNGADSAHGQSATSAEWKAINAADGTLITPNGSGTTSGSVKADHISGKLVWSTNITVKKDESDYETEAQIECDSTIKDGAKLWLYNLGFLEYPGDTLEDSNGCWFNGASSPAAAGTTPLTASPRSTAATRVPARGRAWASAPLL